MPGRSRRSPAKSVRSMPPTNATSSSTITSFSWWQCIGRSCVSSAHAIAVARAELLADAAHVPPRGRVERQRRAPPEQHPDGHALGRLGEQLAQDRRARAGRSAKSGRDVPAGDVDVRAGARDRLGDARQRLRAVDQHLERVAPTRRLGAAAQPASAAVRACSHPILRSRRR